MVLASADQAHVLAEWWSEGTRRVTPEEVERLEEEEGTATDFSIQVGRRLAAAPLFEAQLSCSPCPCLVDPYSLRNSVKTLEASSLSSTYALVRIRETLKEVRNFVLRVPPLVA